jgi:hypothetical protein
MRAVAAQEFDTVYERALHRPAWVDEAIQKGDSQQRKFIECYRRDHTDKGNDAWIYYVWEAGGDEFIVEKRFVGQGSNPLITYRWATMSGEHYGRGPGWKILPAVKTANLVVQFILENAEMSIAGVWQMESNGLVNPENLTFDPGTVVAYPAGTRGFSPLTPGGNFDVSNLVLNEMRHNIRKGLHNETLGPRVGTPASATEVSERMADLARQLGPVLDRILSEGLKQVFMRGIFLLKQRGQIELPVVDGKQIKLKPVSPLAQAQAADDIQRLDRFIEQTTVRFGPAVAAAALDQDKTIDFLAEKWQVPARLLRPAGARTQLLQQAQQGLSAAAEQGADPNELVRAATGTITQ